MDAIKGRYRNGQVILTEPANWPEDTEVWVEPLSRDQSTGLDEADWSTAPEAIARWIAEFEAIPALDMTAEEEAAWKAARQARKDYELSHWEQNATKVERLFP